MTFLHPQTFPETSRIFKHFPETPLTTARANEFQLEKSVQFTIPTLQFPEKKKQDRGRFSPQSIWHDFWCAPRNGVVYQINYYGCRFPWKAKFKGGRAHT